MCTENEKDEKRVEHKSESAGSAIGPFCVAEGVLGGCFQIVDDNGRSVLTDDYAYDSSDEERLSRMEWIAQALTDSWQAEQTGDNMPMPNQ